MANPVWVLSVDLQTKTATFQSGLADAAKSARGAFSDIRSGAGEMGGALSYSMSEARHSVMMLGEEFGVHLPRGLTTFIASLGPIGPAMEAAFPFLAIAVGATMLLEHLNAMHEAGEKLTQDQLKFGLVAQNAFNSFDEKILQAQIRADELKNDHLGALKLQLELIDKQSMQELVQQFEGLAKAADAVFDGLKTSWYQFGAGSAGAKHALDDFRGHYEMLISLGKDKEASDLLHGTRESAVKALDALKKAAAESQALQNAIPVGGAGAGGDVLTAVNAIHAAKLKGVQDELAAQQQQVDILDVLIKLEGKSAELTKDNKSNATRATDNGMAAQASAGARAAAESQMRMAEQAIQADRATADAQLEIHRASLEARLASDLDFAARERDTQLAGNAAQIAALNRNGNDYTNQLKALQDKNLEIEAEYQAKVAEINAKSSVEIANRDLTNLQESEREKITLTQEGTAQRLAAIDAAIKDEQAKQLQDTSFFRDLLTQRAAEVQREVEAEQKARDTATKEAKAARDAAAEEQARHTTVMDKAKKPDIGDDFSAQRDQLAREYAAKHAALEQDLVATETMGQEKVVAQQRVNDQLAALNQKYRDEQQELDQKQAQAEKQAFADVANSAAQSFVRIAEGRESLARLEQSLVETAISNSIRAAITEMAQEKDSQLAKAKSAAAGAMAAVSRIPFIGPALAPVAGAATFAAAMAFAEGTDRVPGVGHGDIVPAMLSPGEGIVPGGVMDGLRDVARNGGFQKGHTYNLQLRPTYHVQALDGDGMQSALEKHNDQLVRHVENALRKMNR